MLFLQARPRCMILYLSLSLFSCFDYFFISTCFPPFPETSTLWCASFSSCLEPTVTFSLRAHADDGPCVVRTRAAPQREVGGGTERRVPGSPCFPLPGAGRSREEEPESTHGPRPASCTRLRSVGPPGPLSAAGVGMAPGCLVFRQRVGADVSFCLFLNVLIPTSFFRPPLAPREIHETARPRDGVSLPEAEPVRGAQVAGRTGTSPTPPCPRKEHLVAKKSFVRGSQVLDSIVDPG